MLVTEHPSLYLRIPLGRQTDFDQALRKRGNGVARTGAILNVLHRLAICGPAAFQGEKTLPFRLKEVAAQLSLGVRTLRRALAELAQVGALAKYRHGPRGLAVRLLCLAGKVASGLASVVTGSSTKSPEIPAAEPMPATTTERPGDLRAVQELPPADAVRFERAVQDAVDEARRNGVDPERGWLAYANGIRAKMTPEEVEERVRKLDARTFAQASQEKRHARDLETRVRTEAVLFDPVAMKRDLEEKKRFTEERERVEAEIAQRERERIARDLGLPVPNS